MIKDSIFDKKKQKNIDLQQFSAYLILFCQWSQRPGFNLMPKTQSCQRLNHAKDSKNGT